MVKVCEQIYSEQDNEKYSEHFNKFPYELSIFQKYAIQGIIEDKSVLVISHTGSGKTNSCLFAIDYFTSLNKKIIYTSPIKALSNSKYYEFTKQFLNLSIGLITGDIKLNPNAQVLIMTTEILLNTLYNKANSSKLVSDFEMDFDNDLGCVVFDEIHMINDADRGYVWENSIMMIPQHIPLVMLSATIDNPLQFSTWIETIKGREVWLTGTTTRVVPLTHYSFITTTNSIYKKIKDKTLEQEIKNYIDKPHILCTSSGQFSDLTYKNTKKFLDLFIDKQVYVKRPYVLNQISKYMVEHEMLPAICFILSRKQLEICAREITIPLLEFDSKIPYTIKKECEQIIRKIPNYQEYLELPEYNSLVALLEKGIGIHHSGMMPVLKEMVELLCAKGYIKLLFATETFAIGVNAPIKTVIFADSTKFDGTCQRVLYSHEYTQMAGRAGRRGIDTVGHVIHLNNLFRTNTVDILSYKTMLSGKPQQLTSKFKISYNLIMNLIDIGNYDFINYANKSMIQLDINKTIKTIELSILKLNFNSIDTKLLRSSIQDINEYIELSTTIKLLVNKKKKEGEKRLEQIKNDNKFIEFDANIIKVWQNKKIEYDILEKELASTKLYLNTSIIQVLDFLEKEGYIVTPEIACTENIIPSELLTLKGNIIPVLTELGKLAIHIKEVHCLIFAKYINEGLLNKFTAAQLIGIFSCFTNISVPEDFRSNEINEESVKDIILKINSDYNILETKEINLGINSGIDYNMHYDIVDYMIQWSTKFPDEITDAINCKTIIQNIEINKGIFLGEFIKAILKINNIANELCKICQVTNNLELLSKLKQIPELTLKFVATNQSLYV